MTASKPTPDAPSAYRDAGVDIEGATAAVERIKAHAHRTFSASGAAAPIGGFGGVYRLAAGEERLLVASADGIGTKIKLAFVLGGEAHARVGGDLVNHCVNDILACGARPLFFLDYVAMGRLNADALVGLVGGMARACADNGLALIGGETAEMPGLYAEGEYDAAGFIVGEVAPAGFVDGSRVREGDLLLGLPSVGLHTNGYSLARRIVGVTGEAEHDREVLGRPLPGAAGATIGDALLAPHPSYLHAVRPALDAGLVRGMAHITGGGLLDNVPRMLPDAVAAAFDPERWPVPPVFDFLVDAGAVGARERYQVFNMGLGFVLAVGAEQAEAARALVPGSLEVGRIARREPEGERVLGLT